MCGIFALFGPNDYDKIYPFFVKGKKRGPEYSALHKITNEALLGFHRLAINGMNSDSNQPMVRGEHILVCNGEIFNYKELIKEYDLKMNTESDCEVILHLYEKLGKNCLYKLDGEFAFVIYNTTTNELFVARDRFGVRPLYVLNNNTNNLLEGNICFSSTLESMGFTDMKSVRHFPPGHYALSNHRSHNEISYINYCPLRDITSIDTSHEHVYTTLCNAVKKRVITSERPVACLLSGGLDSSLVAALANRYSLTFKGCPIETFSIGLADSEDLKYSLKVAEHIRSKHTQIVCTEKDFLDSIPEVIRDIETYDTTTVRASVGNWNVGKYIKEHSEAKVILNGDGADEVMGGYLYFHACPNKTEFNDECIRLLNEIHCFDVLRSDKCISSHGLEPRTPYLDPDFVSAYLSLPASERFHPENNNQEKYIIRKIFNQYDTDLLPQEILFRKKEAFSDGVSGLKKSWYEIIQDSLSNHVVEKYKYRINEPETNEQYYYRDIFESYYKDCYHIVPHFWMPKYINAKDASARTLSLYTNV